jgi:hypothetical protein
MVAIYVSYAAAIASLTFGCLLLLAPSLVPSSYFDFIPERDRPARWRLYRRIGALLIGASIFPLLSGAPLAFMTLACCWLGSGLERAFWVGVERRPTRSYLLGLAGDFVFATLIALPYLPGLPAR